MTQINNQSYVNCQGAPVAGMWPGIFASMSKIKALTFKPPLLYWCIQREVYRSLSGGSILSIKFSRYSVIRTSSTYSLPLL